MRKPQNKAETLNNERFSAVVLAIIEGLTEFLLFLPQVYDHWFIRNGIASNKFVKLFTISFN